MTIYYTSPNGRIKIHLGDSIKVMESLEPGFHSVVTDPPYGLNFMNLDFDKGVPGVKFWEQTKRLTLPGGYQLAFGGTRTFHRLVCGIEDAGWEIRDMIGWLYGEGNPKTATTTLKPAIEPISLSRNPFTEKTLAKNLSKWGTGKLNIEACRIEGEGVPLFEHVDRSKQLDNQIYSFKNGSNRTGKTSEKGRFPSNLIIDDSEEVRALFPETKSGAILPHHQTRESENNSMSGKNYARTGKFSPGSEGSAARFFYCAKSSKAERGPGNIHPTVKPLALMKYLIQLVTPPGGRILDPFMGSGTTLLAANILDFECVGIEQNEEYIKWAIDRLRQPSMTFYSVPEKVEAIIQDQLDKPIYEQGGF